MSHFENAGYRILSFKYSPVVVKKEAPGLEGGDGEVANQNAKSTKPPDTELPSLSSLMTSLQEIEDDSGTDQGKKTAVEVMGSAPEETVLSALRTPTTTAPAPPTEFHLFEDLPTELRLKIWDLTFLPRVVELRSTRPNYSAGHDDGREPQWQSGCSNPAALAVCAEARELALAHFRIAYPLAALVTSAHEPVITPWSTYTSFSPSPSTSNNNSSSAAPAPAPASASAKGRLLRRTLYLSPAADTVCLLGQDSDFARLSGVLRSLRAADPQGEGVRRLGLSVRGWGYGGSAVMMRGLGGTVLRDLEQLVLFMYGEHRPPAEWRERGAAAAAGEDRDALEKFRREGNALELVPCQGSSAWYAYKIWSGGKGRQFWDEDGNIMRIGQNDIKIMDLEFRNGW